MIGFIGGGNMAEALIKGLISEGKKNIIVSDPSEERRDYLARSYSVSVSASNKEVVSSSAIIILAVKPQIIEGVLDEIAGLISDQQTIVSVAAGITLPYLESKLKTKRVIRVMPNTPALVREGMAVMSSCGCLLEQEVAAVRGILMSVGKVITLPESLMNAVTALSGSGPAFIAMFIDALIESGEQSGLSAADAKMLSIQTLLGTARLLDTGLTPQQLREMVTSPGGTTAAGLHVFEQKNLKSIVHEAITAAKERAEELGRNE
ncbi:MAG: pyrroline-5-carboxylate reductase [Nitrospiraceae bacterium]|nr:MAG: pyrroline-5-carboxylate reductase [Nitrospiraceae bacterium]